MGILWCAGMSGLAGGIISVVMVVTDSIVPGVLWALPRSSRRRSITIESIASAMLLASVHGKRTTVSPAPHQRRAASRF